MHSLHYIFIFWQVCPALRQPGDDTTRHLRQGEAEAAGQALPRPQLSRGSRDTAMQVSLGCLLYLSVPPIPW